jgi:hypothetical protein
MTKSEASNSKEPILLAMSAWGQSIDSSTTGPLAFLFKRLESQGFQIVGQEDEAAQCFVSIQHNRSVYKSTDNMKYLKHKILVSYEPKTASPKEYRTSVVEKYNSVIRWSSMHRTSLRETVSPAGIYWHSLVEEKLSKYANRRRAWESISLINAHKHSVIPGSLYSLRREAIQRVAASFPDYEVTLAGSNWDAGKAYVLESNLRSLSLALFSGNKPELRNLSRKLKTHPNLNIVGQVDDGLDLLSRANFALVIENEATYVTEKLPNAILAGCIPIYCGPNLEQFGIPPEVCIAVKPEPLCFVEAIEGVTPDVANAVRKAGREWLQNSKTGKKYSYDSAMTNLADLIIHDIKTQANFEGRN